MADQGGTRIDRFRASTTIETYFAFHLMIYLVPGIRTWCCVHMLLFLALYPWVDPWYQCTDQRDIFCLVVQVYSNEIDARAYAKEYICVDESKAVVSPGGELFLEEKPQRTTAAKSQQYSCGVQGGLGKRKYNKQTRHCLALPVDRFR